MEPIILLIAVTFAGSVGLFTFFGYQWFGERKRMVAARVGTGNLDQGLTLASPVPGAPRRRTFPLTSMLPLSRESEARMSLELERGGWPLRVNEYLSLRLTSAFVGGAIGFLLLIILGLPEWSRVPLMAVMVFSGWMVPRFRLSRARRKRLQRIEQQLPDALLSIAKSLQVGTGLIQALTNAAKETRAPLGTEIQRTIRELHMGADSDVVFTTLAERIGSKDVDIVVAAIVIQRNTGGNLSEILMTVAKTIRERFQLKEHIQTLTSTERLTGNIMALIPPGIVVLFLFMNPGYGDLLFGTTMGQVALGIGISLEVIGYLLIKKLVQIEV